MKPRIAVVVQRYGMEVNGGAEFYARLLSEQLNRIYNVEVLTTCALDYAAWQMHYPPGTELINGVTVRRFVNHRRDYHKFSKKSKHAFQQRKYHHRIWKALGIFAWLERKFDLFQPSLREAHEHLQMQGPYSPELVQYIQDNRNAYDVFIFVTYLYHPSAVGLFHVPEKSIFIPTAHDEPAIYSPYFRNLFRAPEWIFYLTEAEKRFCERLFGGISNLKSCVAGVGIELPAHKPDDRQRIRQKYNLPEKYILYMGRVDKAKNCHELFAFYLKYVRQGGSDIPLVVAGKANMDIPDSPTIRHLGFVDEDEKLPLLQNASLCVIPSKYESLSLIALESYAAGKPILVNGRCEVLKDHVQASGSGACYNNFKEFKDGLNRLLSLQEHEKTAAKSVSYIAENYNWRDVMRKFATAIEDIMAANDDKRGAKTA